MPTASHSAFTAFFRTAICVAAFVTSASWADADGTWTLEADPDSYDGRMLLTQTSADSISDEYGAKEVNPVLAFACSDGAVAMQINWQRFISSFKTEAGFKIDDGDANWLKLDVDSSNKITLANADSTKELIDNLGDGSTLHVEIAPYSEPSVFVSFDIATLTAELERLKETC